MLLRGDAAKSVCLSDKFDRWPLLRICRKENLLVEILAEIVESTDQIQPLQFVQLRRVELHLEFRCEIDERVVESAVICRGEAETVAHTVCASFCADGVNVRCINQFQLHPRNRAPLFVGRDNLVAKIRCPRETGNCFDDPLSRTGQRLDFRRGDNLHSHDAIENVDGARAISV